jgi:peptidyl-prolyl cis-trans isomerase B (cyclophilin B)
VKIVKEAHRYSLLVVFLWLLLPGSLVSQDLADKQVVLETDLGLIVLELFPTVAPQHVSAFLARVRTGYYNETAFFRAVPFGVIQGGDPLSRDPAKREQYGRGGLFELPDEFSDLSHVRGAVAAVRVPGEPNSAGAQFFICVTDQPQLDGQYTIFGRVVEGISVVEQISQAKTDDGGMILSRIEIVRAHERERPPPEKIPFVDTSVEELREISVVLKTVLGDIEIGFYPSAAPKHVRQFLRFAQLGLYTGTQFHRVVPGFVIQGGALNTRKEPIPEKYAALVRPISAEFNDLKHVRGIVSMARADDPNSGVDSFFIALAPQPSLDGNYTVFGEVLSGIDAVDGISQVPCRGETPMQPVFIEEVIVRGLPE